jgi:CHRD domain
LKESEKEGYEMRLSILLCALLAAVVIPMVALGGGTKTRSLHATLTGKAETPAGDPDGVGTAEVKITGRRVCWELKVGKIGKPNAAHIHKGGKGTSGPVVVPFGGAYKAKGCINAKAGDVAAILARPGRYYVNVHNAKYPAGAVRGQLARG